MFALLLLVAQRTAAFVPDAPVGIGIEWMTIAAVVLPAIVIVALTYAGHDRTV